eukprot:2902913-Amphidinium_carterae.1
MQCSAADPFLMDSQTTTATPIEVATCLRYCTDTDANNMLVACSTFRGGNSTCSAGCDAGGP